MVPDRTRSLDWDPLSWTVELCVGERKITRCIFTGNRACFLLTIVYCSRYQCLIFPCKFVHIRFHTNSVRVPQLIQETVYGRHFLLHFKFSRDFCGSLTKQSRWDVGDNESTRLSQHNQQLWEQKVNFDEAVWERTCCSPRREFIVRTERVRSQ